jgi:hypothetical protein
MSDRSNDTAITLKVYGVSHSLAHLTDGESVAATWVLSVVASDMSLDVVSKTIVSVDWQVDDLGALSLGLTFCTSCKGRRYNNTDPCCGPLQGAS